MVDSVARRERKLGPNYNIDKKFDGMLAVQVAK
jgi:hypothetical protein